MAKEDIFVGRKAELEQFGKVLEDPKGQAVLVVGQSGMGKTWLVNRMAEVAENHPGLKCGWVRYEVTPTDSVDSTMALMMDNAFEAGQVEAGSFDGTAQRTKQWRALLNVIKIGDLVFSLKRDPAKNTRDQFLERLRFISKRMPANGRAIFIIDPEKYMQKESDTSWAIVVKELPEKIKIVFAQRPEDALIDSETFGALDNAVAIPERRLDVLEEEAVDELLDRRSSGLDCSVTEMRKALRRYHGHPYALGAALDLIEAGTGLEALPDRPEPVEFAEVQWRKVCQTGEDAIGLFEAYSVLDVGVPDDVVERVSGLNSTRRRKLMADKYLAGLWRQEGFGRRIYHTILADYILRQMAEGDRNEYHSRAVKVYRGKLAAAREAQTKPDALSAMRLPAHVLAVEGTQGFIDVFSKVCIKPLVDLGLVDTAMSFSEQALGAVESGSIEEGALRGDLGLVCRRRGDLVRAEELHKQALEIARHHAALGAVATQYANLGLVYQMKGDRKTAEEMHWKALEINKKLGRLQETGKQYGNLGVIYEGTKDLNKAEEMYRKGLQIAQACDYLEGQAAGYGHLGIIYWQKGELDKANRAMQKALQINETLGLSRGVAQLLGNFGLLYQTRRMWDDAERMHRKSIEISEKLGYLDGIGAGWANLGLVYLSRRHIGKAREYWKKSLALYKRIGMADKVEYVQGLVESLSEK